MRRFLWLSEANTITNVVAKQGDVLLIAAFRGPVDAGLFRLAKTASAMAGYAVNPLQTVLFPRLASSWAVGDRGRFRHEVGHTRRRAGLPLAAAVLAAIPFVPWGLRLVARPGFSGAAPITQVLLVGVAFWVAFFWARPALLVTGHIRFWTVMGVVGTALSLALYAAVVPPFGLTGVAVVQAANVSAAHLVAARYLTTRPWWRDASSSP
jgi:O-antigen/teichoic acid export membrane protein